MLTIPIRADFRTPRFNALVRWVRDVIVGARDGLAMQDRYEALSRLSDRELARHGLTRADFPRLAVNGEHGTIAVGRILFDKDA